MKKEEMAMVSGGCEIAANGAYWLTGDESDKLREAGFEVSLDTRSKKRIQGWDNVEVGVIVGSLDNYIITSAVNYNGERATPEQVAKVLGPREEDVNC